MSPFFLFVVGGGGWRRTQGPGDAPYLQLGPCCCLFRGGGATGGGATGGGEEETRGVLPTLGLVLFYFILFLVGVGEKKRREGWTRGNVCVYVTSYFTMG